ncbi:hypothetical protein SAMN04487960_10789 [Marinobacter mobilis]|uniref:Uncharacterized protein n=1 Tax=Marinobacter mobilis TaxID=488533 RepID=A0A1H2ZXS6_9GAMM|nr:hypothetical protein SAMN04487960_10789 [Marinobacter mobilis]
MVALKSLFESWGRQDGVRTLTEKGVGKHRANPLVGTRSQHARTLKEELKTSAAGFFCTGKDRVYAPAGINVSADELTAVLDDVMNVMKSRGYRK